MARPYTTDPLGGLDLAPIGGQARAAVPRVRAELPAEVFPPRSARHFAVHLAGAAPGTTTAAPVPKLQAYTEDFHPDGLDVRLPFAGKTGSAPYVGDYWTWQAGRGALFAYAGADSSADRVTADPYDLTAAWLTLDITDNGEVSRLDVSFEDRAANQRLRFSVSRDRDTMKPGPPYPGRLTLSIGTERSEGARVVLAQDVSASAEWPNDFAGSWGGRTVRLGFDVDGSVRLEVQRTGPGVAPVVYRGITGVRLPADFAATFNAKRAYVHFEAITAGYSGLGIANVRGSLPLGPVVAGAPPEPVRASMTPAAGGPSAGGEPFTVPEGHVAQLDAIDVALLTAAAAAPVAGATPHLAADLWVRILVDGSPAPGLGELRPTLLLLGTGAYPAGQTFARRYRPRLTLTAGQRLSAELVTRDSAAGHAVECVMTGWLTATEAE